ncbi:MAG: RagB/SusD family nutrient uptake outer membrane protein [Saprospiraceae bacterium]|nr:RagB/SusD family nutrient uptake outer membrane protein [Saprospiraceae bacterium]
MQIKHITKVLLIAGLFLANACSKDFLTENNPTGLTGESAYTTPDGFESLVNAAYSYTRAWYGKEEGFTLTEMGTDLWLPGVDNRRLDLMVYNNLQPAETGLAATEVFLERLWRSTYKAINLCNAGIANVSNSGLSANLQKTREGELRYLRAFYYWHIVEQWGGVHFTTGVTQVAETTANRTPVEAFYAQIFEDLNFAVANLPLTTPNYGRVIKPVAEAFLARMHLTRGNNREASDLAQKVIADYNYALVPNYANLWAMNNLKNSEVIWSVNYNTNLLLSDLLNAATNPDGHPRGGHNGHLHFGMAYERVAAGSIGMQRDIANGRPFARYMPSKFLLNLFDETIDSRYHGTFKTVWICNKADAYKKIVGGNEINVTLALGDTAILATKYEVSDAEDALKSYLIIDESKMFKVDGSINANAMFIPLKKFDDPTRPNINEIQSARDAFVIRLAEMYLIAAEAEFKLSNMPKAVDMINAVRHRAALPGRQADMTITAAQVNLDFILDERAREFAGEQMRWFDLKRTGKLMERVVAHNPEAAGRIQNHHVVRPIPQVQIDAVTNKDVFTQNPGYQ